MRAVLVTLLVLGLATVAVADTPSDLELYIEGIRSSGISEMGHGNVGMIASICVGSSTIVYRADETSGRYWPMYQSQTCPNPNAAELEIERWKKFKLSESDKLRLQLVPFADKDGSGFVTSEESWEFRQLVEFGYLAAQVAEDEGATIDRIARASGMSEEDAAMKIRAYEKLVGSIESAGVTDGFPHVVLADAGSDVQ